MIQRVEPSSPFMTSQDSQEFLHSLLESLQSETNRIRGKPLYKELDGKGEIKTNTERARL